MQKKQGLFTDSKELTNTCYNADLTVDFVRKIAKNAIYINNSKYLTKFNNVSNDGSIGEVNSLKSLCV